MKYLSTFGSLTIFTAVTTLAMPQEVRAFDVEACYKNPMTTPQSIDLLQPIDPKLLACVPELSSIASKWKSEAETIKSATSKLEIGNNGSSNIEKLEYNLTGNYISFVVAVKAAHSWRVPEIREKVPVPKFRTNRECSVPRMVTTYSTVKECLVPKMEVPCAKKAFGKCVIPGIPRQTGCSKWVEKQVPSGTKQDGCNNWVDVRKPDGVEMQWKTITPATAASVSTTCKYDYTFNISTTESKPVFSCGRGALGEYKLDASAITSMLKGEMPTMASLLQSVSITPPLFRDNTRDEYNNVRNDIISRHPGSVVYFSSESFVNWASVKTQGTNIIIGALTAGSYSPELVRQLEEKMQSEVVNMTTFTSQIGQQLVPTQIVSILTGNGSLNLKGFDISVKAVKTPKIIQTCMVQPTQRCLPEIEEPRLGFAIIATRKK